MRRLYVAAILALITTGAIWSWRLSYWSHRPLVLRPAFVVDQTGSPLPELTAPVNDFAGLIDHDSAIALDAMIRSLKRDTGDVIVVATLKECGRAESIKACSMKLFENHGKGIGQRGKDNGVLVLVVAEMRQVRITLGYGIEPIITDQDAAAIAQTMVPALRSGRYGDGFRTAVQSIISRIRAARGFR